MATAFLSHDETARLITHLLGTDKDEAEAINAQYEYALTTGIGRPAYRLGPKAESYVRRHNPAAIPDPNDVTFKG